MNTRKEKMHLAVPLTTTETLRPLVQLFLDKMTSVQWGKLESGYVDEATEDMITDMCVDILNTVSRYIYEAFKQSLLEEGDLPLMQSPPKSSSSSSGSDGSRKNIIISENQVQDCLGETISLTFAEVMGVQKDIRCKSTKEVTELVVKEVTERVNTELSNSSGTSGSSSEGNKLLVSKSSTRRLKPIVRHVVKILKKCTAKMTCTFSSSNDKKGQPSPKMEADETKSTLEKSTKQDKELLETVESGQTPIATVEEDGPEKVSSGESFVVTTTEAVKKILKEQGDNICAFEYVDDFSHEELDLLASSSSQDTDEAASEIVKVIMEELKLETDGTPKKDSESEDESRKTSCWKRVVSKIKAFFVHKFAKESILSFVAKLRSKLDCFSSKKDKSSLKLLIEGVDSLVEDMIPPQEDQEIRKGTDEECLYQRIARGISSGELEMIAKQLSNEVSHYLKLGNGCTLVEIQTQVDKFMKLMWNWLNQQAQQHERKRDLVSVAQRQIERVVGSLPGLTEFQDKDLLETVESGQTPITTVEEDGPEKVSSGESFVVTTTEAVKKSLKEQGDNICAFEYVDDFSHEELDLLASSSSQDTDEAASEIVKVIMEELKLETDGTPKKDSESEDESRKTSCWKRVVSKIKAFFVHKFAKESILSFVAKLRSKLDCFSSKKDKSSLKLLIEGVDSLVEDMIPPQEDQEIRKGTDEDKLASDELRMVPKQQVIAAGLLQEPLELCCVFLVSGLVNQILKNLSINLSGDNIKTTIQALNEMLWAHFCPQYRFQCLETRACLSFINVKPSSHYIKRTVKAVHKDLCKKMGSAEMLQMSLLSQDELIYKYIIETLIRHVETPKKRSGFKSVFKTMAKPFSACFRCGRKE